MKKSILLLFIVFGSLNLVINTSFGSSSNIIDQETKELLLDANRLIKLRKRTDARQVLSVVLEKLDTSIPLLDSVYKRVVRVRFNLRKRRWFRAQSIFRKVLIDLNISDEFKHLNLSEEEGMSCQEEFDDFLYQCQLSFGNCAPTATSIEVCFILLDKCREAAQNKFDRCEKASDI